MQEGSREVLQRLIYFAHPEHFNQHLKYFDEKERVQLASLPKVENPLQLHLDPIEQPLHLFHYSWYIDCFKKCPKHVQPLLLTIFNEEQIKKIEKILEIKLSSKKLSSVVHKFFSHWVLKQIGYDVLPPICFFSHVPGFKLLSIEKRTLVKVLHQLGILDIANMSKRIVDKKTLNEILKFLSPEQKKFFNEAQKKYNEPLACSIKELNKQLEDDRNFTQFLEKRGLLRLAMALANENSFLVWHLAHILDQGRGTEFLSIIRRCIPSVHTAYYTKQLFEIAQINKED